MISFWDRARLSFSYGWVLLICGALFNVVSGILLATSFIYSGIVLSLILKVLGTGVMLYLQRQFEHRDDVFFYINLGLSRKRLMAATLAIDFGFLLLLEILIALCQ